ncbi:MAG TPA: MerP protein, partial [Pontibacter sp.]
MNKLKVLLFSMMLALASMAAQAQNGNQQTIKIKTSAVCDMCKTTLEKTMAYEKGVKSSSLDVNSKILTVVFDNRKTDEAKL